MVQKLKYLLANIANDWLAKAWRRNWETLSLKSACCGWNCPAHGTEGSLRVDGLPQGAEDKVVFYFISVIKVIFRARAGVWEQGWCHPRPSRSWAAQSSRRSGLRFAAWALWSCIVTSPSDEGTARAALGPCCGHSCGGQGRAASCHQQLLWTQGWGWPGQPRLQHVRARGSVEQGQGSKCNLARSFSRGRWRTHCFYSPNSTFLLRRINPITKWWNQRLRKSHTRQASLGKCSGHADLLSVLFTWRILPA